MNRQGRLGQARRAIERIEFERQGRQGGERRRKDRLGRHGKEPGGNARLFCFVEFA